MAYADQDGVAALGLPQREIGAEIMPYGAGRKSTAELILASRAAIAQSFAAMARVPDLSVCERLPDQGRITLDLAGNDEVRCRFYDWMGAGTPSRLRFFFDVGDGETERRDEVGIVLAGQDEVVRETKALLTDLAFAALPEGRSRLFTASVRNVNGHCVYKGSMKLNPFKVNGRRSSGRT